MKAALYTGLAIIGLIAAYTLFELFQGPVPVFRPAPPPVVPPKAAFGGTGSQIAKQAGQAANVISSVTGDIGQVAGDASSLASSASQILAAANSLGIGQGSSGGDDGSDDSE